MEFLRDRDNH